MNVRHLHGWGMSQIFWSTVTKKNGECNQLRVDSESAHFGTGKNIRTKQAFFVGKSVFSNSKCHVREFHAQLMESAEVLAR